LLNEEFLHECWRDIRKDAAYGVDRVSAKDYEQNLDENIHDLVERLKRKHAEGAEPNSSEGSTSQKATVGCARQALAAKLGHGDSDLMEL